MDKIAKYSMMYNLIQRPLLLWVLMYFLSVLGVFCKFYFNFKDSFWVGIIFYLIFLLYLIVLPLFQWKSSQKIYQDDGLDWESRKYLLDYNHDLYYKDKKFVYLKLCLIAFFTFNIGLWCTFSDKLTLIDFTCNILTTFGVSIYALHFLLYDVDNDNLMYNSFYGFFINSILVLFVSVIKFNFGVFTSIFNVVVGNIDNFFILSLTVILLGATLSLLAFTYNMVLDDNDDADVKKEMKSIGEKFFISTLFSMLFLLVVFLLSMYCAHTSILSLGNINFISSSSFIMVNIFVILLFLFLFTLSMSLMNLIIGVISSLNNLPFKF